MFDTHGFSSVTHVRSASAAPIERRVIFSSSVSPLVRNAVSYLPLPDIIDSALIRPPFAATATSTAASIAPSEKSMVESPHSSAVWATTSLTIDDISRTVVSNLKGTTSANATIGSNSSTGRKIRTDILCSLTALSARYSSSISTGNNSRRILPWFRKYISTTNTHSTNTKVSDVANTQRHSKCGERIAPADQRQKWHSFNPEDCRKANTPTNASKQLPKTGGSFSESAKERIRPMEINTGINATAPINTQPKSEATDANSLRQLAK